MPNLKYRLPSIYPLHTRDLNPTPKKALKVFLSLLWDIVYLVIAVFFFIRLYENLIQNKSIAKDLIAACGTIDKLTNDKVGSYSEAILKVAETIGFGSILIAWVYGSLDNINAGVKNRKLLPYVCANYHYIVVIHLVSILLCIGLCKVHAVDAAFVALLLVFFGGIAHWSVISALVFHTDECLIAAKAYWLDKIEKNIPPFNKTVDVACEISRMLSTCDITLYDMYLELFYESCMNLSLVKESHDDLKVENAILNVSKAFENTFVSSTDRHFRLQRDFLQFLQQKLDTGANVSFSQTLIICSGFLHSSIHYYVKETNNAGEQMEKHLEELLNAISELCSYLNDNHQSQTNTGQTNTVSLNTSVSLDVHMIFTYTMWMYFFAGEVNYIGQAFGSISKGKDNWTIVETVLRALSFSLFSASENHPTAMKFTFKAV